MDFTRIVKNVLPAVVVLVAGLFGINFIYNTYMKDGANTVITLEPAAGEEEAAPAVADDGFGYAKQAVEEAATTEEAAKETAAVADCTAADAAATAAMGTEGAEAATKAAEECHEAAKAAADTAAAAETATEAAEEAAPAADAPAAETHDDHGH